MWNDVAPVKRLVQGMKNSQQPFLILRYTKPANMRGDGDHIYGFEGFRIAQSTRLDGSMKLEGSIDRNETCRFWKDEFGTGFAAIPLTEHNKRLILNCYGELPVEIDLEDNPALVSDKTFTRELEKAKLVNIARVKDAESKINGGFDSFNMTVVKKPEQATQVNLEQMRAVLSTQNNAEANGFKAKAAVEAAAFK